MGKFLEVSEPFEFQLLRKGLRKYLPTSSQMLNVLELKGQGRFSPATLVDFHVYENSWEDPFVLCVQHPNIHSIYSILIRAPVGGPSPEMMEAFESFVPWERAPLFPSTPQDFFIPHLQALCLKHGGLVQNPLEGYPCEAYVMEETLALSFEEEYSYSREGGVVVRVRELDESHAAHVVENYEEWAHPESQLQIQLSIRNLASTGLFVGGQEKLGELASFSVLSPLGLLNILSTGDRYRRQGFGKKVLKSLGKRVAKLGLTPRAECHVGNDPSRQLQLKAGFKFAQHVNWVRFR